jgi:hypothetical protein
MEPIALKIVFSDGTEKSVIAVAADLIGFEQHFDKSVTVLTADVRLTYLFWICWHVLKRTGQTSEEFEKWAESVAGVVIEDSQKK